MPFLSLNLQYQSTDDIKKYIVNGTAYSMTATKHVHIGHKVDYDDPHQLVPTRNNADAKKTVN